MIRSPSLIRALSVSRAFSGVEPALLARVAAQTVHAEYTRGDVIFTAGERATCLGVVTAGLVRIHRPSADGDTMVAIVGPRETIGILAACDGGRYPVTAVSAVDDTRVARVDADLVRELMATDLAVAQGMIRALSDHAHALHTKLGICGAGSVEQRMAVVFLHLLERFGDQLDDGAWVIPVVLTRSELAALVDATIETTIRTVSRWQKRGVLATARDGFLLPDPGALGAMLDAAPDGARIVAA